MPFFLCEQLAYRRKRLTIQCTVYPVRKYARHIVYYGIYILWGNDHIVKMLFRGVLREFAELLVTAPKSRFMGDIGDRIAHYR